MAKVFPNIITVFTTGTFDILHYGHINLLEKAKEMGDYLIVGLNVTKDGKETYYSYEDRKRMLESIKYVDEVIPIFFQEDKYSILESRDIDIFAIGSDYIGYGDIEEISKYAAVRFIDRTPDISTSKVKADLIKYKRIIVDVDDTLCTVIDRDFINAIPHQEVINKVNEYYDKGYEIVISTARGQNSCKTIEEMKNKYEKITREWLDKVGIKYHQLEIGYKQNADMYVDDKAINPDEFVRKRVL